MFPLAARRALDRRMTVLARALPPALGHDADALHRSRVASRRLRAFLATLDTAVEGDARRRWRKIERRVRSITRALGGVRELDVALASLDELARNHQDLAGAVDSARAAVTDLRTKRFEAMLDALAGLDLDRLDGQMAGLVTSRAAGSRRLETVDLRRQVEVGADRLERAIGAAGAVYALDRLHRVRIAAKKLRYTLEIVHELGGVGTRRLQLRLRKMQDLLGRMHDLDVLAGHVRQGAGTATKRTTTGRLLDAIEHETRQLHAVYLAGAPGLRLVAEECRVALAARLDARAASVRHRAEAND